MSVIETVRCERYRCTLTKVACVKRRDERKLIRSGGVSRKVPAFPACAACSQGKEVADEIGSVESAPIVRDFGTLYYGRANAAAKRRARG